MSTLDNMRCIVNRAGFRCCADVEVINCAINGLEVLKGLSSGRGSV